MSQYPYPPPPYAPPIFGWLPWSPPVKLLGPARIAALIQSSFGGCLVLLGLIFLAAAASPQLGEMLDSARRQGFEYPQQPGYSAIELARFSYRVMGAVVVATGAILLVLAMLLSGGELVSTIASLVVNIIIIGILVVMMLIGLFALSINPMAGLAWLLVSGCGAALCGSTILKLTAALRTAFHLRALRLTHQTQFMALQQSDSIQLIPSDRGK